MRREEKRKTLSLQYKQACSQDLSSSRSLGTGDRKKRDTGVVPSFETVDEILWCKNEDRASKQYFAVVHLKGFESVHQILFFLPSTE